MILPKTSTEEFCRLQTPIVPSLMILSDIEGPIVVPPDIIGRRNAEIFSVNGFGCLQRPYFAREMSLDNSCKALKSCSTVLRRD